MKGGISDYMKYNTVLSSYTKQQTIINNVSKSLSVIQKASLQKTLAPVVNLLALL